MNVTQPMQEKPITSSTPCAPWLWRWMPGPAGVGFLALLLLLSRWFYASLRQLIPDEAYYWVWSRHPASSYLDHPAMIAYLIHLGTLICGNTELGVRLMMGPLAVATPLMLMLTFGKLNPDAKSASYVAVSLLLSPVVAVIGFLATIDTPAIFFQTAALCCVLLIFAPTPHNRTRGMLWIAFGLLLGLALDSKYTSVLLGVSVFLALITSSEGRGQLKTVWPWLGAVAAMIAFLPVIYWNAGHHWLSFRFQLNHGLTRDDPGLLARLLNLGDFFGAQAAISTPVFFGMCLFVMAVFWRRRRLPMHWWITLFSATLPLVFFGLLSIHKRGNGNWPLFAYFPATLLIAQYLCENPIGRRIKWAQLSIVVSVVALVVIHLPRVFVAINPKFANPQWDRMFGWSELAAKVNESRGDSPVFTTDYEFASELQFYLPGHPAVWPIPEDRPTAFDAFGEYLPPRSFDRILLVRRKREDDPDTAENLIGYDFPHRQTIQFDVMLFEHRVRRNLITVATKVEDSK